MAKDLHNDDEVNLAPDADEETFLDLNLEDVPSMRIHDDNTTCRVRVNQAKLTRTQSKQEPMVTLYLEDADDPTIKRFAQRYTLGNADDTPRGKQEKLSAFKDACDAFGVAYNGGRVNLDEFVDKETYAVLRVRRDASGQYDDTNDIRKFVASAEEDE